MTIVYKLQNIKNTLSDKYDLSEFTDINKSLLIKRCSECKTLFRAKKSLNIYNSKTHYCTLCKYEKGFIKHHDLQKYIESSKCEDIADFVERAGNIHFRLKMIKDNLEKSKGCICTNTPKSKRFEK